ncbi:hypothetical protein [Flavobacterium sp.]|uniref:hypothetical protein n=1 Tax=Flavobacterium sp. TaxID=239 RepID=UPI00122B0DF0|nr:hypothetical protein [Flavobacterium sp.]RZJ69101.1 MAG: hypothetical protein EOO49_18565 [Flavobacterium sp.]
MKTLKLILTLLVFGLFVPKSASAQNQTLWVHDDHVKPGKHQEFDKVAKELAELCKKYDVQGRYDVVRMDDGTCRWVEPIANMAALDKNPFQPIVDKIGKDKFGELMGRFDKCYDSHNSYIVTYVKDLSYVSDKPSRDDNYAKFHYLYVKADQDETVAKKIKALKELYTKKNAKEYFEIYHSGFGCAEEFYCAVVWTKDESTYIKQSDENEKLLGDEGEKTFADLMSNVNRYETHSAWAKPQLGYSSKK